MAGAEAATGAGVLAGGVFTEGALPVAVSMVVGFTGEASAVALSATVAFVVAVLRGATGAGTGAIIDSLMMSSLAATVTPGGGAGTIRTDTTVTTITRTITMDTADPRIIDTAGTVTTVVAVTDTAIAAD